MSKNINFLRTCRLCQLISESTDYEWEAARAFRQKYFFDKVPIADPYTWTFDLWSGERAALRIIVIDERIRAQGLGSHLLALCEQWLKERGYEILQTQSSPEAYAFYKKLGYIEMPFNDPDGYEGGPCDIDLRKSLSTFPRDDH